MKKQNKVKNSKKTAAKKQSPKFNSDIIYLLIITGLVILVYFKILAYPLGKLDEDSILTNNMPYITNISNLGDAFSRGAYFNSGTILFYRPMQNISFMFDAAISGGEIWGFYLSNIIIHLLTCFLLFYLFSAFIKERRIVFYSVLLFALNPLFTHSLAWTPSRGDLLLGMFGAASFLCFLKYEKVKNYIYLLLSLLFYGALMLSKESAVIFPGVIVFYLIFREGRFKNLLKEMMPLVLYTVLGILYLLYRNSVVNAVSDKENFGLGLLFGNLQTFPELLGKFFIPANLSPMPVFSILSTVLGLIVLAALIFIALKNDNINKESFWFAFMWFAVLTFPGMLFSRESGNFGYQYLEHRSYLPSIGLALILGLIINSYYKKDIAKNIEILLVTIAILFAAMSFIRSGHYKSGMDFYNYAVDKNPKSTMALNNRGMLKNTLGDKEGAIADFREAVTVKPDYFEAYNNLGFTYSGMKNGASEALQYFNKSLEVNPAYPDAYYNRAITKNEMGDKAGAMEDYNLALKYRPNYPEALVNRSMLKKAAGDMQGALNDCDLALSVNPNMLEAILSRGTTYFMMNNFEASISDFTKALEIDEKQASTFVNRGAAFFQLKRFNEAISDLSSALNLNPNLPDAYFYRALCYQNLNRISEACADLQISAKMGNPNATQLASSICK